MGKRNISLHIVIYSLIFHLRYIFRLCLHTRTPLVMLLLKAEKPQTDRQTLWPCSGSCSLPAGPWGFLSRELPRAVAEMRLLHMGSRAQSAHNQASRDIRKPKPLHSISITMSKALVVANVILQMENHEGSGPVGNQG